MRKNINKTDDPKNNDLKVMFSHNSDHWATPKEMYNKYMKKGYILTTAKRLHHFQA